MAERLTENEWQARTTEQAGLAIGEWLLAGNKLKWRVEQLTRADLAAMASNAISRYIQLRQDRESEGKLSPWFEQDV